MSKYLIQTVETYRVDKEAEAKNLIETAKADGNYILKKYNSEYKERKQKGEVIDAYFKVSLTKCFTDEKDPQYVYSVDYSEGDNFNE